MIRYTFALIAVLSIGIVGLWLFIDYPLMEIHSSPPNTFVERPVRVEAAQCGCVVDEDEQLPKTPQELRHTKEKLVARQNKSNNKNIVIRLRHLVRVGMTRGEVERFMGMPTMSGPPDVVFGDHPAEDAGYYGGDEVAYSALHVVTWIGSVS